MPGPRSIRAGLVDTGFAVADRLEGVGLGRLTHAARRLVARAGIDEHTVEVHGVRVSGSLADHGTYLHSVSGPVGRSFHLEVFAESIPPGATVVDCGAHIGLHTLVAARAVGEGGTVVSLEPVPQNARALRSNVEDNGFEGRVEVVEAAATRDPGSVRLHLHPWLDRAGLIGAGDSSVDTIEVAGLPLDDALGDRRFDVAKIDVEGAEALALSGFERALARSSGATVFVECHPDRMRELGENSDAWLRGLSARGPLELVDEGRRRLIAADEASISRWVERGPESFNLRWRPER
jgi:FkbM family methyltransferase